MTIVHLVDGSGHAGSLVASSNPARQIFTRFDGKVLSLQPDGTTVQWRDAGTDGAFEQGQRQGSFFAIGYSWNSGQVGNLFPVADVDA